MFAAIPLLRRPGFELRGRSRSLAFLFLIAFQFVSIDRAGAANKDIFSELRDRYTGYLTGAGIHEIPDMHLDASLATLNNSVTAYRSSMIREEQGAYLWKNIAERWGDENKSRLDLLHYRHIQSQFDNLRTMALAFRTPGSEYFDDVGLLEDIVDGLRFMKPFYSDTTTERGNWWQWRIGIPYRVLDINILLHDAIDLELREHYVNAVDYFVPEVTATGANRVDRVAIRVLLGIVSEDFLIISDAKAGMQPLFELVTAGSGFYPDGSAIFHNRYPYTMHYQVVELGAVAEMMYLLAGSPWEIGGEACTLDNVQLVYDWIYNAFESLVFRGQAMSMVVGRMQTNDVEAQRGVSLTRAFLLIGEAAQEPHRSNIRSIAKGLLIRNTYRSFFDTERNATFLAMARNVLSNESIAPRVPLHIYRQFYNMDRAVLHREQYAFGISMLSDRINNYSVLPDGRGATRGWHTAHGMTYLYNSDLAQFNDYFWDTVNAYRLPGTTVNQRSEVPSGQRGTQPWAGGVDLDGTMGASSMHLVPHGQTLEARKSWFLFGDEIVALGAGITSGDDRVVESVVENRKIRHEGDNILLVDGRRRLEYGPGQEVLAGVRWAHLEGNVPGSDIGYFFPDAPDLHIEREQVTIDAVGDDYSTTMLQEPVSRSYISMLFDHGMNPSSASYQYVILPGMNAGRLQAYAADPEIEVLENSPALQAVTKPHAGITAFNLWQAVPARVGVLALDRPAAVMYRSSNGILEIALAEPAQEGGVITVEVDGSLHEVVSADEAVSVIQRSPLMLRFDMSALPDGLRGRTVRFEALME